MCMVTPSIVSNRRPSRMRPLSTNDPTADHVDRALAERYQRALRNAANGPRPSPEYADCTLLMVRGLFGSWIPNHFRAPLRHFKRLGWQVEVGHTAAAGTLASNAAALGAQIDQLVAAGRRPIFLAHSKGGLEVLLALAASSTRVAATAGLLGVQVPRGGSPYLEHLFAGSDGEGRRHPLRFSERMEAVLLTALGARRACAELNTHNLQAVAERIESTLRTVPSLMVATSAQQMSNVFELRSKHLQQAHPGQAHDGVFLRTDQVWSGTHMLMLDGIDHAQPSVGGLRFAHQHFWAALLATLLD